MDLSVIVPPVVGSVIGYSTNWLAIKMLFKPHEAKYIGKLKIPFTPGVIPRERQRIASSLGEAVGNNLLTDEVILNELTGVGVTEQLKAYVVKELLSKPINLNKLLLSIYSSDEELKKFYENLSVNILKRIDNGLSNSAMFDGIISQLVSERFSYNKPLKEGFGEHVDEVVLELITGNSQLIADEIQNMFLKEGTKEKLTGIISTILLEKIGGMAAMFVQPESIYGMISDYIIQYVQDEKNKVEISGTIAKGLNSFLSKPISEVVETTQYVNGVESIVVSLKNSLQDSLKTERAEKQVAEFMQHELSKDILIPADISERLSQQVEIWYRKFVEDHLPTFMDQFNVSSIVENEINQFSVSEVESLIFNIVDKELNAITWFGAILGFGMGLFTLFF